MSLFRFASIHKTKDDYYVIAIVGFFFMKVLGTSIDNIWGYILIWQVFSKIVQLSLLLPAIYYLLQRPKYFIFVEMLMSVIYLSGFLNADLSTIIHGVVYGCCIYIPLAFVAYRIENRLRFLQALYFFSWLSVPLLTLSLYIASTNGAKYDMTAGYLLLLPLSIFTLSFLERLKISDLFMCALSALSIILYCSRGPILCFIFLIVVSLLCMKTIKTSHRFFFILLGSIIIVCLVTNYDVFISIVERVSNIFNINSRSITLFLRGEGVSHLSGRDVLLEYFIGKIKDSPLIGYGAFGAWPSPGKYPHNIFIELLVSLGVPIGSVLSLGMLFILIRGLTTNDIYAQKLILVFMSMSVSLLVSGSFLMNWHFYVCIALCLSAYNEKRYIKHRNQE